MFSNNVRPFGYVPPRAESQRWKIAFSRFQLSPRIFIVHFRDTRLASCSRPFGHARNFFRSLRTAHNVLTSSTVMCINRLRLEMLGFPFWWLSRNYCRDDDEPRRLIPQYTLGRALCPFAMQWMESRHWRWKQLRYSYVLAMGKLEVDHCYKYESLATGKTVEEIKSSPNK